MNREYLREMFIYEPSTGWLIRKCKSSNALKGSIAGYLDSKKYICINVYGKQHKRSRLVWLYHYGWMPDQLDHINHNTQDDRLENLRPCSNQQNQWNQNPKTRTSKYKGVSLHKKTNKWQANIGINNKFIYLGLFKSETNAAKAYNDAAIEYFGEFAKLNEI